MEKMYVLDKDNEVIYGNIENIIYEAFNVSKEDADEIALEIRYISSPWDELGMFENKLGIENLTYEDITLDEWLDSVGTEWELTRR